MPSNSNTAITGRAHSNGLFVTTSAQRRQNVESADSGTFRRMTVERIDALPEQSEQGWQHDDRAECRQDHDGARR